MLERRVKACAEGVIFSFSLFFCSYTVQVEMQSTGHNGSHCGVQCGMLLAGKYKIKYLGKESFDKFFEFISV